MEKERKKKKRLWAGLGGVSILRFKLLGTRWDYTQSEAKPGGIMEMELLWK